MVEPGAGGAERRRSSRLPCRSRRVGTHLLSVDDPTLGELRVLAVPRRRRHRTWLLIARTEELGNTAGRAVLRASSSWSPCSPSACGLLVWFGVGRALRPVEAIRASVGDITEHHLCSPRARPRHR